MPTEHEVAEALRADPGFQAATDSYLLLMLVLAHGKQSEARGVSFREWLGHMEALLGEYTE